MKVIVGLGNPGPRYERTRHNAGFMVADRLLARHAPGSAAQGRFHSAAYDAAIAGERCLILKPTLYMNRSGAAVAEAASFYKVDPATDLLVIVDDTALPLGQIRLRAEGSAGGHNGLADIERALGRREYPRLRVGVDTKPAFMDQADYVLGKVSDEEWGEFSAGIERAADAAERFVSAGIASAMNAFNTRIKKPEADSGPSDE